MTGSELTENMIAEAMARSWPSQTMSRGERRASAGQWLLLSVP
jgi:hypothetical protein